MEYCLEYLGYLQCTSAKKQTKEKLSFQRGCGAASIEMYNVKMIGGKGVYNNKSAIIINLTLGGSNPEPLLKPNNNNNL